MLKFLAEQQLILDLPTLEKRSNLSGISRLGSRIHYWQQLKTIWERGQAGKIMMS